MRLPRTAVFIALLLISAWSATPAHAATKVVATTPVAAVHAAIIGFYNFKYNTFTCSAQQPDHRFIAWSTCPFTTRLKHRLRQAGHANKGVEMCGNQFPPRSARLRQVARKGDKAKVSADWNFGTGASYTSTFVVLRHSGHWLVDDEYLFGKPAVNIYNEGRQSFCRGR